MKSIEQQISDLDQVLAEIKSKPSVPDFLIVDDGGRINLVRMDHPLAHTVTDRLPARGRPTQMPIARVSPSEYDSFSR